MIENPPPLLPRSYRLAWLLLWFALLGALAWSAGQPRHAVPTPAIGAQPWPLPPSHGGSESPVTRHARAGAVGETAFRQP